MKDFFIIFKEQCIQRSKVCLVEKWPYILAFLGFYIETNQTRFVIKVLYYMKLIRDVFSTVSNPYDFYIFYKAKNSCQSVRYSFFYLYYIFMNKAQQFAIEMPTQEIYQHYFVMKMLGDPQERTIIVDLSASPSKNLQISEQCQNKKVQKPYKTDILFNKDGRYYSPTFLSHSEHQNLGKNFKSMLHLHVLKQKNLEQKDDLFVPVPAKINHKCEICQVLIEDYFQHCDLPSHKRLLSQKVYNRKILEMCEMFKPKTKKISKKRTPVTRGISWNQLTEEISREKIQFQKCIISLDSEQSRKPSVEQIIIE